MTPPVIPRNSPQRNSGRAAVAAPLGIMTQGRLRIIVRPEQIDDLACIQLSRDIAKRIEETMEYPGQIKVTVVRETRVVEYAK